MEIPCKLPHLKFSQISTREKIEKLCLFIYTEQITISFFGIIFFSLYILLQNYSVKLSMNKVIYICFYSKKAFLK